MITDLTKNLFTQGFQIIILKVTMVPATCFRERPTWIILQTGAAVINSWQSKKVLDVRFDKQNKVKHT